MNADYTTILAISLLGLRFTSVGWRRTSVLFSPSRAFISTRPLVHKYVKISVGKWLLETTRPHKHVKKFIYTYKSINLCITVSKYN